jgi:hypothetical protein
MNAMLILVQAVAQNIALLCCALYTGAAVYVCLVEHPAMTEGGKTLADAFVVVAHPRTTIFHAAFGIAGALAGMLAGVASGRLAWLSGALLLAAAAAAHVAVVMPFTQRCLDAGASGMPAPFPTLARLHAGLALAGLAPLFLFIQNAGL